jgi:hypothetical protein
MKRLYLLLRKMFSTANVGLWQKVTLVPSFLALFCAHGAFHHILVQRGVQSIWLMILCSQFHLWSSKLIFFIYYSVFSSVANQANALESKFTVIKINILEKLILQHIYDIYHSLVVFVPGMQGWITLANPQWWCTKFTEWNTRYMWWLS